MNIFVRIKNNLEYTYYRKLLDRALIEMKKHENDKDDREWKKWANVGLNSLKKCDEIPLK